MLVTITCATPVLCSRRCSVDGFSQFNLVYGVGEFQRGLLLVQMINFSVRLSIAYPYCEIGTENLSKPLQKFQKATVYLILSKRL